MRKSTAKPPTDEEILGYDNVPVYMAAKYIGWSTPTLYSALQQERAPFGFAVQNLETDTWTYNISPGLLKSYKHGELPTYRLREVINLAADGIEQILALKLERINKVISALGGIA